MFRDIAGKFRVLLTLMTFIGVWGGELVWGGHDVGQFKVELVCAQVEAASGKENPEEAALTLFQEAKTFFENGDMKGALLRLKQAWSLFKQPVIALQLAEVHEKLGQPEEALEALKALDQLKLRDVELRQKVEVRKNSLINFLKQPLAVSVISDVSTSRVQIDGGEFRYPPFDIQLPRGKHIMKAEAVGYRDSQKEVDIRGSVPMQIRFSLQPLTGTMAVRTGQDTLAGLQIMVDGVEWKIEETERSSNITRPRTAKVGNHQVVCWHEGRTKDIQNVIILEGGDLVVNCRSGLAQRDEVNQVWGTVALGAAVGSAAAGGYLLYAWQQDMNKAERENLNISTNKHYFGGTLIAMALGAGVASYYFYGRAGNEESDNTQKGTAGDLGNGGWVVSVFPGKDSVNAGALFRF